MGKWGDRFTVNATLEDIIVRYATGDPATLREQIDGLSKDTLASIFVDLLTLYINDENSSSLRELITVRLAGYALSEGKLGYNGYRLAAPEGAPSFCEAKPVNVRRRDGQPNRKLNGGGNFSDYTPERLEQDLEENPHMLVSGFVDGKLIYILEFPFKCLETGLRRALEKQFPGGNRPANRYLRSAHFTFRDYQDCPDLRRVYCAPNLDDFKDCLSRGFYGWLKGVVA